MTDPINLVGRAAWGARPRSSDPGGFSSKKGFQLHHSASPRALSDHGGCDDQMRSMQAYHMDQNDWSDLAYNFVACNHGFTFEGRGWLTQNGASGNAVVNDTRIAICWIGHSDKDVFDIRAANQIKAIEREGNVRGWPSIVGGHRDFSSTTCPGNVLYEWMRQQAWADDTAPIPPTPPTPTGNIVIVSYPTVAIGQMQRWAVINNASRRLIELATVAHDEGSRIGVDPAVIFAIMAHETAFGRFGGVLDPSFHNWGGIKTNQGGSNDDPNAHQRFTTDRIGVRAVAQHAGIYGGLYVPADEVVDPRHFEPIRGQAIKIPSAGWTWAGPSHDDNVAAKVLAMRQTP